MIPKGTLTRKTYRQLNTARMPPRMSPMNWPESAATWFSPSAFPRSSTGNASVRMAAELAKRSAAPTPWTSLKMISSSAAVSPVPGVINRRTEPRVKMPNPRFFTLPYMSERRPKLNRRVAVTTPYPISTQRRYWNEERGSIWMPLKMAGREMRMMLPFTVAMNVPMVVFERA